MGYSVNLGAGNSSLWFDNWLGTGTLSQVVPYVHISDSHLKVGDCWSQGSWCLDNLATSLPTLWKERICHI
uniref:Uncharacterized protein n=1 Tax=Cajanus cajan TaxID=3821 RepID=A0A151SR54_CAJCA|nr:hypothetical protein KK1_003487 [Cajanus cajan]